MTPFSEGCDMAKCNSKKSTSGPFFLGAMVEAEKVKGRRRVKQS